MHFPGTSNSCWLILSLVLQKNAPSHFTWIHDIVFHFHAVSNKMSQTTVESGNCEKNEKQRKFPTAIPFILLNVFTERFCSGGILGKFWSFHRKNFSQNLFQSNSGDLHQSKTRFRLGLINCTFSCQRVYSLFFFNLWRDCCWFLAGLVQNDFRADTFVLNWNGIGRRRVCRCFGAADKVNFEFQSYLFHRRIFRLLSLVGLLAVFVASGGMKTNQNVFGGNQFKLPEQESQLNTFFSVQYFVLKCGLLVGQMMIPVLRNDVKCFGMDNCFPLAFGLPAALMLLSFVVLLLGKSFYVNVPPAGNMFVKVCKCIAVRRNWLYFLFHDRILEYLFRTQSKKDFWSAKQFLEIIGSITQRKNMENSSCPKQKWCWMCWRYSWRFQFFGQCIIKSFHDGFFKLTKWTAI